MAADDEINPSARGKVSVGKGFGVPAIAGINKIGRQDVHVVEVMARSIQNDALSPTVIHLSPGIGKPIIHKDIEESGGRLVPEDRSQRRPLGPASCFHLGVEERSFHKIQRAIRPPLEVIDRVLDVFATKSMEYHPKCVRLVISIGVFGVDNVRGLSNVCPAITEGKLTWPFPDLGAVASSAAVRLIRAHEIENGDDRSDVYALVDAIESEGLFDVVECHAGHQILWLECVKGTGSIIFLHLLMKRIELFFDVRHRRCFVPRGRRCSAFE